ncbi:hypothetical protein SASPL_130235 [Salvia splendens]|uniref:Aquaporin NIP n=1 Tax=Salvia splendens TaxID=180675 RepID=A0A8X8ZKG5_SALSN|nr:hypothetical protein SASPL_130235 [Salvia splendens]
MAETSNGNGNGNGVVVHIKEDADSDATGCCSLTLPFIQKIIAETLGTFFVIFAGCGAVAVNADKDKVITLPGISIVWGLVVMVMVYSVGHISGAHFNPAVTLAFATCKRFPWKQVPAYIAAQVVGSTLAAGTLRLLFSGPHDHFTGTLPAGTDVQSLVVEFIITFYLMFVISGVATDNRAIGELAGLAVGAVILLNVMFAGSHTAEVRRCCGPVAVNLDRDKVATLPGIAMVWGLVVMVMIYSVGHFNPAVSIAFASCNKFPWRQV